MKDWSALRNFVGNNIKYRHDEAVYGVLEYWLFGKETVSSKTGDCEDFAILLCSLLRAAGYSANDVYVVFGKNPDSYHAWVKINLGTVSWYSFGAARKRICNAHRRLSHTVGFSSAIRFQLPAISQFRISIALLCDCFCSERQNYAYTLK